MLKGTTNDGFVLTQSTRHLNLPVKGLGVKLTLPSDTYKSSQLITRNMLKQPKNPDMRDLYKATAPKNIKANNTLLHQGKMKNLKGKLVNKTVNKILDDMKGLTEQRTVISRHAVLKICKFCLIVYYMILL